MKGVGDDPRSYFTINIQESYAAELRLKQTTSEYAACRATDCSASPVFPFYLIELVYYYYQLFELHKSILVGVLTNFQLFPYLCCYTAMTQNVIVCIGRLM